MAAPLDVDSLRSLLHAILTTLDNGERRQSEIVVVKALRSPSTVVSLVHLLRDVTASTPGVRQLAAVLVRKKIFSLWRSLPLEHQAELKSILLTQLGLEPGKMVRFAIAHVVSILAKAEARDGNGWPELQGAIYQAMQSEIVDMRELAMVLAYSIAEAFADEPSFIQGVGEAVVAGIQDTAIPVRLAALKAVSVMLPFLHGNKAAKAHLHACVIPVVLSTVRSNLTNPDTVTLTLRTLEIVEQLCEDLHSNTHSAYLVQLVDLLVEVFGFRGSAHVRIREHCSEVLGMVAQNKPKFLNKSGRIPAIVQTCLAVMAEEDSISFPFEYDEEEDTMDDDDVELLKVRTPCMFAARLLNMCCTHLSPKAVTHLTMDGISRVLDNPQAAPLHRKAAIVALACLAEGNPGYLRRKISMILNAVQLLLQDTHPIPREAAAFALIYFSEHLQPEILAYHSSLIPLLTNMLQDPSDNVRRRVAETLDSLCENIAEDLDPYIPSMMPLILQALPVSSPATQEALVSSISSIAQTQCPSFMPFAEGVLTLLREPMTQDLQSSSSLLRAKATEAVGIVATAIGRERFQPFFDFFMAKVVECLQAPRAEFREQAFGFLANMCEMLRADFLPFLDASVGAALASLARDVGHMENKHLLAEASQIHLSADDAHSEGDTDDDDDDDSSDDANEIHYRVRTADVEEKSSAVFAIGVFAEVLTVEHFGLERLRSCWATLKEESGHFHANVRSNVLETLTKIAIAVQGTTPVPTETGAADGLSPQVRQIVNELLYDVLLSCMAGEVDKEVVAAACDALNKLMDFYGAQTFAQDITDLCAVVATLLRHEAPCQTTDEDAVSSDGDDAGDDAGAAGGLGEDHDHVLIDSVSNVVDGLAAALGSAFEPYFRQLAPDLLPFLAEGRPAEDFTMAAGTLANCYMKMGPVSAAYLDQSVAIAVRIIAETDESAAKANCCFMLRALLHHCHGSITSLGQLQPILAALWQVAASQDEIPQARDNAISAACTVVLKLSALVPLETIVPTILQHVPMKVDRDENANAILCLCFLLEERAAVAAAFLSDMLSACARVALDRSVEVMQKQTLGVALVSFVRSRPAPEIQNALRSLHPAFQKVLSSIIG